MSVSYAQDPAASTQTFPQSARLIEAVVYSTVRPTNQDIYLYGGPNQTAQRLTEDPALDYNATFSPDGRWLVFTSERAGGGDLYALDLETGAAPVRLTHHRAFDDAAAFSPDGERLAFVSTRDGDADIFVMPFEPEDAAPAEAAAKNLTHREGGDFNPAFSPDGRRIAYSRQDTLWFPIPDDLSGPPTDLSHTHSDVYVMNADGSEPTRLSEPGGMSGSPAWSDDGEHIYYYRMYDPEFFEGGAERGEGLEIRRVAADGAGDAFFAAFGQSPAVMPSGRVAFFRMRPVAPSELAAGLGNVVSVAADGSDPRVESDGEHSCEAPAFDPGSSRMACHGPGPVETLPRLRFARGDRVHAPPGARRRIELPDRTLAVHGVLGQFPAVLPDGDIVWSLFGGSTGGVRPAALTASRIDGSEQRELFALEGATIWAPAVARDAGWIVASVGPPMSGASGGQVDIWKLRIDGSDAINLTSESPGNDALATISADGRQIVFRSVPGPIAREIHVMDGDGRDRRKVDVESPFATMPSVSPDGEWLVFPIAVPRAGIKLWLQKLDGSEGRLLEPDRAEIPDGSLHPRFSPDGRWVVFTSDRGHMNDEFPMSRVPQPYGDLWAVPVAGGTAVRLTDDKWEDGPSDWGYVRAGVDFARTSPGDP
jgi:Tol biopolymer transport system component